MFKYILTASQIKNHPMAESKLFLNSVSINIYTHQSHLNFFLCLKVCMGAYFSLLAYH